VKALPFSQIVTVLGIAQVVASQVQAACGQDSHWGAIAAIAIVVCGKAGHIIATMYPPPSPPAAPGATKT
jgi:hypothetical protein